MNLGNRRRSPSLPLGARRRVLLALGDRRFHHRYPIAADLEYRAIGSDGSLLRGSGQSINLSASGVFFQSKQVLPPGTRIELTIAWPVRLNNVLALNLCVSGRVSRSDGISHAVRIREHEFCIRGRYRLAGPRFRTAIVAGNSAAPQQPVSCPLPTLPDTQSRQLLGVRQESGSDAARGVSQ
jgi:PilZ domain